MRVTKLGYIYCYKRPEYIRTRTLKSMIRKSGDIEIHEASNSTNNIIRYFETIIKLLILRATQRPDVYLLAFRGYEIYWPVRIITIGKPLIFDEFINMHDWFVFEHKKLQSNSLRSKLLKFYMKSVLLTSQAILADTKTHAVSSSNTYQIPIEKYKAIYVGADEEIFRSKGHKQESDFFTVFFYGTFLPLHGMNIILEAANILKDEQIKFVIIGGAGREEDREKFRRYIDENNLLNIAHRDWVEFDELPKFIDGADLCLGGPFGDTPQAHKVITGKTFQFLAMGKPVVVGETGEHMAFQDKSNCLLVPQGEPQPLAEAILWSKKNRDKLSGIGDNGKSLYGELFSTKAQSKLIEQLIKKLN